MEVLVEDIWTPYKELQRIVETAIINPNNETFARLQKTLPKFKQNFLSLLKNVPKNQKHREELQKGSTEGLQIPQKDGRTVQHVLPETIINEALILSNMYDLNEYICLDLLGTAALQTQNYPGLARGVVAVLLYYDGRKTLAWTLRTLIHTRRGNLWETNTSDQVAQFIQDYTDDLIENGLFTRVLDLLGKMNIETEIEILRQNGGLGPPKYHQQVIDLYETTRVSLAEILYLYSAQSGLPETPTISLITLLKKYDDKQPMDNVTLTIIFAILYSLDLSLIHREDGEIIQNILPLVMKSDNGNFLRKLQTEFQETNWKSPGLRSLLIMAWSLTLSTLNLVPQLIPKNVNLDIPADVIMNSSIELGVFDYLYNNFLLNEQIYKEEFFLRRIHSLFTDFLVQMSHKVDELRLKAEDADKTYLAVLEQGLEPKKSSNAWNYELLLCCLAKMYRNDPLDLKLELDYWCSPEDFNAFSLPSRGAPRNSILYTFIKKCGEFLPNTLFVSYVKMLCSLSSCPKAAKFCYYFLKHDNHNKNLTWEHIFDTFSKYFNYLKFQNPPPMDTVYSWKSKSQIQSIRNNELQGLQVILELIETIAENDIVMGEMFVQIPSWNCPAILIGLMTCSIPVALKSQIVLTVSALAKSSKITSTLWPSIESAQLIPTINSTSTYTSKGILGDIEEFEPRQEEYLLTKAFLKLLLALTDHPIPTLLGAGLRVPGFDPYLDFILNHIVFPFYNRRYKNPQEKWEICNLGMTLIMKLLLKYDPNTDDFFNKHAQAYSTGTARINPDPGYHIMISLCSPSELLTRAFGLIHDGTRLLDQFDNFPGKSEMEEGLLSILKILEYALNHQMVFMNKLNSSTSSLLLSGLSRLILGINTLTNKPDHLLNIAKFITYDSWLPKHALPAVNILTLVMSFPTPSGHLLSLFTSDPITKRNILHGFVTCLETEERELETNIDYKRDVFVPTKTKIAICNFLLMCLPKGVPNVSHFLFGFDLTKEISKNILQQPVVPGTSRSCFHSILSLLNSSLYNHQDSSPSVLKLCYKILYGLAANVRTSEPILRYLRTCSGDFLKRHLAALPFSKSNSTDELDQMAWLLKTVAIEMRVTAAHQQLTQLYSIVDVFTGNVSDDVPNNETEEAAIDVAMPDISPSYAQVLHLIRIMDFQDVPVSPPELFYFDRKELEEMVEQAQTTEDGMNLIDLEKMYKSLTYNKVSNVPITSQTQYINRNRTIENEIKELIQYCLRINESRRLPNSSAHLLESWKQATEVMFTVVNGDKLKAEKRINLLFDLIYELVSKVVNFNVSKEIAILTSDTVFILSVNIRQCFLLEINKGEEHDRSLRKLMISKQSKLSTVVVNLIKWILAPGMIIQNLRVNLYGSLLNCLNLIKEVALYCQDGAETRNLSDQILGGVLNNILIYGEKVVDVACNDGNNGHDVLKMLAFSFLNTLIELDNQLTWVPVLSSRGYLNYIIDSLMHLDKGLIKTLTSNCHSLRELYVYESKMSFLLRTSVTTSGAELLLELKALDYLATLEVFSRRPEYSKINFPESGKMFGTNFELIPSVISRYLQIFLPALSLCDSLLSVLTIDNQILLQQVLKFLMAHHETVDQILRCSSPFDHACFLKELALLSGVIARSSNPNFINIKPQDPTSMRLSTQCYRIQKLMFSLISRFVISESLIKDIQTKANPENDNNLLQTEATNSFFQIIAHLLLYARNLVTNGSEADRGSSSVIFQPVLLDDVHNVSRYDMSTIQEATLGVIVHQLIESVSHHKRESENLIVLKEKLKSVPGMTRISREMLPNSTKITELDDCRRQVSKMLHDIIELKKDELKLCNFIIEHCLYIIWAHLDYYMLRGLSHQTLQIQNQMDDSVNRMEQVTWIVTSENLNHLKQGLVSIFNDLFTQQLISTTKECTANDQGFLKALVRRIKKCIQFVPNS